jgi:hypothetical protein
MQRDVSRSPSPPNEERVRFASIVGLMAKQRVAGGLDSAVRDEVEDG